MEIVHVVLGKANPERINGVNKVVHELATRQVAAGMHVTLWGIAGNLIHDYPGRVYTTMLFKKTKLPFVLDSSLTNTIKTIATDTVFHLHGGFIPEMFRLASLLKKHNIPYVFTPHGSYNLLAMQKNNGVKRIYRSLFEHKLVSNAAVVHMLGNSEVDGLATWTKTVSQQVIPYGFEIIDTIDSIHATDQKFRIGFCGRIDVFTKGLDALVKGFAAFSVNHPNTVLEIIGDGGEIDELRMMIADYKIQNAVVLHGSRFGKDKIALLSRLNVFAHPSRNEGLPTAVLEAAALGLPCLVTRATNVGESITDFGAGVVIDNCSSTKICDGLHTLYNAIVVKKTQSYGRNAATMIKEAYNWDTLIKQYRDMYTRILQAA